MNLKFKPVLILLLSFPVVIAFQNCGKTHFQNMKTDPNSKVVGSQPIDNAGTITDGTSTGTPPEDSDNSDGISEQYQWVLAGYSRLGKEISLPKKEFRLHLLKNPNLADRNCKGDCGNSLQVIGQSFCGAFKGIYTERFDENSALEQSQFSGLSPIVNAADSSCDETEKLLETEIVSELEAAFTGKLMGNEQEITLSFQDGSTMLFVRKSSQ